MPNATKPVVPGLEPFEVTYGGPQNNQPEYNALTVLRGDGMFTSRWTFTPDERKAISEGADILLTTLGRSVPPVRLQLSGQPAEVLIHDLGVVPDSHGVIDA